MTLNRHQRLRFVGDPESPRLVAVGDERSLHDARLRGKFIDQLGCSSKEFYLSCDLRSGTIS